MEGPVVVELVDADVVRPLRHAVLRPGWLAQESLYKHDNDPDTAHAAVRVTAHTAGARTTGDAPGVVAVGTVLVEPPPWEPHRGDGWRVRGMATRHDARRRGLGGLVLDALLDHVASHGGGLVWCNARVTARGLYERAGFVTRGELFELPGIGPHNHMWRTVGPTWRTTGLVGDRPPFS